MAVSQEEILDTISGMSVMEVVDLIAAMEDKFGVSAAAAVAARRDRRFGAARGPHSCGGAAMAGERRLLRGRAGRQLAAGAADQRRGALVREPVAGRGRAGATELRPGGALLPARCPAPRGGPNAPEDGRFRRLIGAPGRGRCVGAGSSGLCFPRASLG